MQKVVSPKKLPKELSTTSTLPSKADSVFVSKSTRELFLLSEGKFFKRYRIALGKNPEGSKLCEGDCRTPEGEYLIDYRNPKSRFSLSLHIDYPNSEDEARAKDLGHDSAGCLIMIHGTPNDMSSVSEFFNADELERDESWRRVKLQEFDWTHGCIAVSNEEIEEIYRLVEDGTPIWIQP